MKYEDTHGGIVMDPSQSSSSKSSHHNFHFPLQNIHTISPKYLYMMRKKAHLVIRMLENRIGFEMLLQVSGEFKIAFIRVFWWLMSVYILLKFLSRSSISSYL